MFVSRNMAHEAAGVLRMQLDEATPEMVANAYRSMAKAAHPDAGGSAEDFARIDRAKCVLVEWLKKEPQADPVLKKTDCHVCHGTGRRRVQRGFRAMTMQCGTCHGSGDADIDIDVANEG